MRQTVENKRFERKDSKKSVKNNNFTIQKEGKGIVKKDTHCTQLSTLIF